MRRFSIFRHLSWSAGGGFTLVEAIFSLVIVTVMLCAALSTVGSSRLSQQKTSLAGQGQCLAQAMLAEIMAQDYEEPNDSVAVTFGPEPGEASRSDFDDVDDYQDWSRAGTLLDKEGTAIPGTTNWTRSVTVEWVQSDNPETVSMTETWIKRATVQVKYQDMLIGVATGLKTQEER